LKALNLVSLQNPQNLHYPKSATTRLFSGIDAYNDVRDNLPNTLNTTLPELLYYDPSLTNVTDRLIERYMLNSVQDLPTDLSPIVNVTTDVLWVYPTYRVAQLHRKYAPVFLYEYTYKGIVSFYEFFKAYDNRVQYESKKLSALQRTLANAVAWQAEKEFNFRSNVGSRWCKYKV